MKFEIRDWSGKLCFGGITFSTFEDARDYIRAHDPEPDYCGEDRYSPDYAVTEI